MSDKNFIALIRSDRHTWNAYREKHSQERVNIDGHNLDNCNFEGYNLSHCHFYESSLQNCNFNNTEICWSSFIHCKLSNSTFLNSSRKEYTLETRLMGINLRWSSFASTNLENVQMKGATLEAVHLHNCNLKGADISNSLVNGISAWGNYVDDTTSQNDLIITEWDEPTITVDSIEIAQFLYLMVNNDKIRCIIDSLATKVVLILGSFAKDDKHVLDQIKQELRKRNFLPVIFDFNKPVSRNFTETVSTLAHLSKFIVADLTNSRSIPHELATVIPSLRSVPVIPIITEEQQPYGMFKDFYSCLHVAEIIKYNNLQIVQLVDNIVLYAKIKLREINSRKQ